MSGVNDNEQVSGRSNIGVGEGVGTVENGGGKEVNGGVDMAKEDGGVRNGSGMGENGAGDGVKVVEAANGVVKGASGAGHDGSDGALMRDQVEAVLRTVFDPEIPVNIFDLGLVYEIKIEEDGKVKITMTLTAPACPVAGEIVQDVQQKIEAIEGVADCHVQLTFDPPWTKEMMTEEAKLELGFL